MFVHATDGYRLFDGELGDVLGGGWDGGEGGRMGGVMRGLVVSVGGAGVGRRKLASTFLDTKLRSAKANQQKISSILLLSLLSSSLFLPSSPVLSSLLVLEA